MANRNKITNSSPVHAIAFALVGGLILVLSLGDEEGYGFVGDVESARGFLGVRGILKY